MKGETFDLIIVGAGPAGMTAGVFSGRKGVKTLVLSKNIGGQVNWTSDVENYMGFQDISGAELMNRFEEQMKKNNLSFLEAGVTKVQKGGNIFSVLTGDKEYLSKAVVMATGKKPRMLKVPGEREFTGKGVSYCSTCDAPLYHDMAVAVVGGGNSAVQAVLDLSKVAREIHLLLMESLNADNILQERLTKLSNLHIHEDVKIKEIMGDKLVNRVRITDLKNFSEFELDLDGIFIEIGLEPNSESVDGLVSLNTLREIIVDCHSRTNVDGLMAAGDVTNVPEKQIIIAAGEGAKAALSAVEYLLYGGRPPAQRI